MTEIAVSRPRDRRLPDHTRAQVRLRRPIHSIHLHRYRPTRWRALPRAYRVASPLVKSRAILDMSTHYELRKFSLLRQNDRAQITSVLQQHLQNPPTPRLPTSPISPGFPSPPVSGSSRLGFLNKSPTPDSPSSPHTIRRKSSFGISLKSNKSDDVKLPREFLLDFWGALANEDGDLGWKAGVTSFLSMIKKGTKTEAGMNLREIPTLLEGKPSSPRSQAKPQSFLRTSLRTAASRCQRTCIICTSWNSYTIRYRDFLISTPMPAHKLRKIEISCSGSEPKSSLSWVARAASRTFPPVLDQ